MNDSDFFRKLITLPAGAYDVRYRGRRYLLRLEKPLSGRLIKLYAEELGGNDIVSGNYYPTVKHGTLKPCEMSKRKVIEFITELIPI